jgi:hypothetical protein
MHLEAVAIIDEPGPDFGWQRLLTVPNARVHRLSLVRNSGKSQNASNTLKVLPTRDGQGTDYVGSSIVGRAYNPFVASGGDRIDRSEACCLAAPSASIIVYCSYGIG